MPKKGENIYKRKDGRWEGRYIKARTPMGKIVYGYTYAKKYSDLREKLIVLKSTYAKASYTEDLFHGTVEEWLSYWLENIVKTKVKPSTYANYKSKLKNHIIPFLGNKKLLLLQTQDIEGFAQYLIQLNLSVNSIKNTMKILKNALNKAVQEGYLTATPFKNIDLPKGSKKAMFALNTIERKKVEVAALKDPECSPVILALYTGMRIGEISGLKWSDIDFENDTLQVKRTLQRVSVEENSSIKTKIIVGTPKTESSYRMIPLSSNLKAYLLLKQQNATSSFVINCKGTFAEPRVINYRFKQLMKEVGLEHVHFHVLRHTFATMCVEQGADIASLSKLLGHTSIKMTLDTYTDSLWENRRKAVSLIDKSFEEKRVGNTDF